MNLISLFIAQDQAPTQSSTSLLEHVASGGPIGYAIIVLSFMAMALIVTHIIQIRASRLAPPEVVHRLDVMLRDNNVAGAIKFCQTPENDSFLTRVFGSALVRCSRSPFGFLELRSSLEEAGQEQVARLYRSTDGIGLIASVSPMLGLLGTVVGMVGAFDTIARTEGFAKPDQLAGSISVALITTVLGLCVAIPCTAIFSYFRNRIDHFASEVSNVIEELAVHLESQTGDRQPAARRPGPAAKQAPRQAANPAAVQQGPTPEIAPQ